MRAYVINMDSAQQRWQHVSANLSAAQIDFVRVPAVNGRKLTLPIPEFSEAKYRLCHGKLTNLAEIGCYLSHIKSLKLFLESSDEFGIICEDDIRPVANLQEVLHAATQYADTWDILRLSGIHDPHPVQVATLVEPYSLCVTFSRLCGSGAYMVHRRSAAVLTEKLLPMYVPLDHALDREWGYGLRAAAVIPLPVDQDERIVQSQITGGPQVYKLPWYARYWTTFPYRAVNVTTRVISRWQQLQSARRTLKDRSAA